MTRPLRVAIIALTLMTLFGNVSGIFAGAAIQQDQITGGYGDTSNRDPEAVAAARFAIKKESRSLRTRISLVSIEHAEVQVVAGLNYRLCLKVRIKGRARQVTAVIYKNLKQKYSLTSWSADGCQPQ